MVGAPPPLPRCPCSPLGRRARRAKSPGIGVGVGGGGRLCRACLFPRGCRGPCRGHSSAEPFFNIIVPPPPPGREWRLRRCASSRGCSNFGVVHGRRWRRRPLSCLEGSRLWPSKQHRTPVGEGHALRSPPPRREMPAEQAAPFWNNLVIFCGRRW